MLAPADIDLCTIFVLSILLVGVVVVEGILNTGPVVVHITTTGKPRQISTRHLLNRNIYLPGVIALEELFAEPLAILTAPDDDDAFPVMGC